MILFEACVTEVGWDNEILVTTQAESVKVADGKILTKISLKKSTLRFSPILRLESYYVHSPLLAIRTLSAKRFL